MDRKIRLAGKAENLTPARMPRKFCENCFGSGNVMAPQGENWRAFRFSENSVKNDHICVVSIYTMQRMLVCQKKKQPSNQ